MKGHVFGYLYAWNLSKGRPGKVYSPSTGFLLNQEEIRCGDTVWVSNGQLASFLTDPNYLNKWVDACPEFVVELKSPSDRLSKLKRKMTDTWLASGVLLGWLIDPEEEVVYIYRQGQEEVEEVTNFDHSTLRGEEVLPGFLFPLAELTI